VQRTGWGARLLVRSTLYRSVVTCGEIVTRQIMYVKHVSVFCSVVNVDGGIARVTLVTDTRPSSDSRQVASSCKYYMSLTTLVSHPVSGRIFSFLMVAAGWLYQLGCQALPL
jgi:hypothetical protein